MFRALSMAALFATGLSSLADAQVPMATDQLDHSADIVRQNMLRHATVDRNRHGPARATRGQIAACANKRRFQAQYGADNARVRRLYALCAGIGR